MKISVAKGYKGQCWCGQDATTTVWMKYDDPIEIEGFPKMEGIWHQVCDDCLKPDDKIKED